MVVTVAALRLVVLRSRVSGWEQVGPTVIVWLASVMFLQRLFTKTSTVHSHRVWFEPHSKAGRV